MDAGSDISHSNSSFLEVDDDDGGEEHLEKGDIRPVALLLLAVVLHLGGEDGGGVSTSILEGELLGLISFFFYAIVVIIKIVFTVL